MNKLSGIYVIKNKVNNKVYVGSALCIETRWSVHKSTLNNNAHKNKYLQFAFNKYGSNAFEFEIFENVTLLQDLLAWEQAVIEYYESNNRDKGYNLRLFADSNLGFKHSIESKLKMSKSSLGKKHSLDTIRKMSLIKTGKKLSPESVEKTASAHRGKIRSEQTKAKIATSRIGKTASLETKTKMSASRKGKGLGATNSNAKLTQTDVAGILGYLEQGMSQAKIAALFKVSQATICLINKKKVWISND